MVEFKSEKRKKIEVVKFYIITENEIADDRKC